MASPRTDRQQVLFDRLVTLGEWATSGELPLKVLEITGFGSFFRGKPRPHDVDLILRVQRPDHLPEFDRFVALIYSIRNDWDLEDLCPNPTDAVHHLHSARDQRVLGVTDRDVRRFGRWLGGYSWKMLRPQTIMQDLGLAAPEEYAKRMVKRELPNLNVIEFLNPNENQPRMVGLRCGFTVSIWSANAPDTASNLDRLLSDQCVTENVMRELAYFEVQLPLVRAHVALLRAKLDLLLQATRQQKTAESHWQWLEEWSKNQEALRKPQSDYDDADRAAAAYDDEQWGLGISPSNARPLSRQKAITEADRTRQEIKACYQEVDILEKALGYLAYYQSGAAEATLSAKEYVVTEMLGQGRVTQRKNVAACLREMGLPVPSST